MRIVLTWQPGESSAPQTVYVEDATDRDVAVVEAAFAHRDTEPDSVLELANVSTSDGDPERSKYIFRVGRLRSFEVQR